MRLSVYDPARRDYRVNFACSYMLAGRGKIYGSRLFDTCFEMGDGDEVIARIYRRAIKNPRLMEALPRYLSIDHCRDQYARIFGG